jgi:hypothetical protein
MDQARIEIELLRAPDDTCVNEPEFQNELREFSRSLHAAGAIFSQRAMAFDSVEALGYPLAEFVIKTLAPAVIPAAAAVCGAWVQARYGRRVRLKIGDVEAEGRTTAEVEDLLKQAASFRIETLSRDSPKEPS